MISCVVLDPTSILRGISTVASSKSCNVRYSHLTLELLLELLLVRVTLGIATHSTPPASVIGSHNPALISCLAHGERYVHFTRLGPARSFADFVSILRMNLFTILFDCPVINTTAKLLIGEFNS